ncbi:MAG: response regulator transcription factor [Nocardioides sp.]|nr:response regulator transcription factor [Nocardioides sp.]
MDRAAGTGPVRLAIVNDYEIVVSGLASMLEEHRERVHVVEINAQTPVLSDVDVVLVDTFGQLPRDGEALADLVRECSAPVVIFSWELPRASIVGALTAGAGGYLCKSLKAKEIVDALEAIRDGEIIVMTNTLSGPEPTPEVDWPGQDESLSPRESEVLAFITQGLSNDEIARNMFLSINSVKTYIRTTYRKIGVSRRSQAVAWGMRHGFVPASMRSYDPGAGTR